MRNKRALTAAAAAAVAASVWGGGGPAAALGADGTWSTDANNTWLLSNTTPWLSGVVADGAGSTANFAFNITADRTVTLGENRTIGNLTFNDLTTASSNWVLARTSPFVLTLQRTDLTRPTVNVVNQTATITAVLAGAGGLQKTGTGALVLSGANTYAGGTTFVASSGTLRVGADTVVSGGTIVSGPLGVGDLTINTGNTFQDNGAARTLANSLVLAASTTFSSSGSGSLTFDGTALTTPATITVTAASAPTLTVTNTTTFANPLSASVGIVKAGSGTLNLNADNSTTWSGTPTATVSGGVLRFGSLLSLPQTSGRTLTASAGGAATVAGALTQAFVDRVAVGSAGVVALSANTTNDIDLTAFTGGLRLGASGGTFTYSGTHTPTTAGVYRLGGGGGTLTYASLLTGGSAVNVGNNGTAAGAVILSNASNDFTGKITVDAGTLAIDVADGVAGAGASRLGPVPSTLLPDNLTLLNAGLIRYLTTSATLAPTRGITLGTGGGGVDTNGLTIGGFNSPLAGTGGFIKDGAGTLTLATALPTAGGLTVRGGGTSGVVSTLNLGTADQSVAALTVAGANVNGQLAPVLTTAGKLTVTGAAAIGSDGPGTLTLAAGGRLVADAAAANFIVFNRPTTANLNGTFTGLLDASAAASVDLNVLSLIVANGNSNAAGNGFTGTLTMPTASTSTVNVTTAAAGAVRVGVLNNNGATAILTLGGGTNVVRTNTLSVGAGKVTGSLTIAPGGSLDLQGLGGGKVAVSVGDANVSGTSIATDSKFDVTGGTIGSAAAPARLTTVTVGAGTIGSSAGTTIGRFTLDGATSVVEADGFVLALGRATNTSATTGILQVRNGLLRITSAAGIAPGAANAGTGARTSTVELLGGTIDMAGSTLGSITTLAFTSTATGLTAFTGGTLRDAGAIARAVTQTGTTSRLELAAASTSIAGAYTVTVGTTAIQPGRTLSVAGAVDLTGAADTLLVSDPSGTLLAGAPYDLVTFTGGLTGNAHYDAVRVVSGSFDQTFTDAQATTPGNLPNGYTLSYDAAAIRLVPEPTSVAALGVAAAGLLARRR
ncbi:MAG: hypothetical protein JWO31_1251, partial [Phycisphaerales bacterium]|nr:hypothetical protein [Phycisphaerales bacterium]